MSESPATCPKCGSDDIRFREKRNDWFCDGCDHRWDVDTERCSGPDDERREKVRLFLSYGRRDARDLADRLCVDLTTAGYEVWQDTSEIPAGSVWERKIVDGLRSTQLVLAVLSPHAVRVAADPDNPDNLDSVCLDELSFARFAQPPKPIVPVMARACEPPFCIFRLNYIDMCAWNESDDAYRTGLAQLLEDIPAALAGKPRYRVWDSDLRPRDFTNFLTAKRRDFVGREWLFKQIDAWRVANAGERALLITGDPGTGKSAIVAELVHRNPAGQVLAYHCCQWDTPATLQPGEFVRNVAAMIASKLGGYAAQLEDPAIKAALSESRCREDAASAFEEGILAPLETLPAPEGSPRYILVDALDEALAASPNVVDLLASRLDRLPGWIRIVATTRNEQDVLNRLRGLRAKELSAKSKENLDDVDAYIHRRLDSPSLAKRLARSGITSSQVARVLHQYGEGNFLYVQQALKGIERDNYQLENLQALPPGLYGLYQVFFRRSFPDAHSFQRVKPVLQVAVAAQEPLDADQIGAATGIDPRRKLPEILAQLASYLPRRSGDDGTDRVAIYHKSLAEWLTAEDCRAGHYFVNTQDGHERLAECLWNDYQAPDVDLSPYGYRHLAMHLLESESRARLLRLLTDTSFTRQPETVAGCVRALRELDEIEHRGERWGRQNRPCSRLLQEYWQADRQDRCDLLLSFATQCEAVGRWGRAHQVLTWIHDWSVTAERPGDTLKSLIPLAQIESARGNVRTAHFRARRAYELAKQLSRQDELDLDELRQLVRAANTLGRTCFDLGNDQQRYRDHLESARELFREVETLSQKALDDDVAMRVLRRAHARASNNLGVIARIEGDTDEAERFQQQAWQLRRDAGSNPRDLAWSARDCGWLAWDKARLNKAKQWFDQALKYAIDAGDPQAQLWVHRDLEQFFCHALKDSGGEAQHREAAYSLLPKLTGASIYYDLAGYVPGQPKQRITLEKMTGTARRWYEKAIQWYEQQAQASAWRGRANAQGALASTYLQMADQDLQQAHLYLGEESRLVIEQGATEEIAESLGALARLGYRAISEVASTLAGDVFQQVLTLARNAAHSNQSSDIQQVVAHANHGLGIVRLWEMDRDDAVARFRKAVDLRCEVDPARVASAQMRLGSCYLDLGDITNAQSCLEDACQLAQSWYDAEAETSAYRHLSELHLDRTLESARDIDTALQCAEASQKAANRSPSKSPALEATNCLGDVYLVQGRLTDAASQYDASLELARDHKRVVGGIHSLLSRSLLEAFRDDMEAALRFCHEAAAWASQANVASLNERTAAVENYLQAWQSGSDRQVAYDRLRQQHFRWLPDRPPQPRQGE